MRRQLEGKFFFFLPLVFLSSFPHSLVEREKANATAVQELRLKVEGAEQANNKLMSKLAGIADMYKRAREELQVRKEEGYFLVILTHSMAAREGPRGGHETRGRAAERGDQVT